MITYELIEGYPKNQIVQLTGLLSGFTSDAFKAHYEERKKLLCCFAQDGSKLVGCKFGFQTRPGYFESTAGEVNSEYRKRGIATKLLALQHQWCLEAGFIFINTFTTGNNVPMLLVNLKAGFEICGFQVDRHEIGKVVLQKQLRPM